MKKIKVKLIVSLIIVSLFSVNGFAALKEKTPTGIESAAKEKPAKKTKEEKEAEKEAKKAEKEAAKLEKAEKKAAEKEAKKAEKEAKKSDQKKEEKAKVEKAEPEAEAVEEAEVLEDEEVTFEADAETDAEAEDPDLDVLDKKKGKKNKKNGKNYIGWIDSSNRNINITYGNLRFKAKPRLGTFNIAVLNEEDKPISVFSTANEYTTTSFYLKAGNKLIKLNDDTGVKSAARKIKDGIQLGYRIDRVADVVITFNCMSSVPDGEFDTVKITSQIYNRGKKKTDMAVKLVMDTVFGETDRHHFYDQEGKPVKNEIALRTFEEEKWYVSKNSKAAMQIIFVGGDCTVPELVALANYSTLDTVKWEPEMVSYRAFDTVLSYNNSAAGIIWPSRKVAVDECKKEIFYLSFATDGKMPVMGEILNTPPEPESEETAPEGEQTPAENTAAPVNGEDAVPPTVVVTAVPEDTVAPQIPASGTETIPAVKETGKEPQSTQTQVPPAAEQAPKAPAAKPADPSPAQKGDAKGTGISMDYKYTPEYIQSLLNRIQSLSDSGDPTDKEELLRLNAELDKILGELQKF